MHLTHWALPLSVSKGMSVPPPALNLSPLGHLRGKGQLTWELTDICEPLKQGSRSRTPNVGGVHAADGVLEPVSWGVGGTVVRS